MKTAKNPQTSRRHVERFLAFRLIEEVNNARNLVVNERDASANVHRADAVADVLRDFLNGSDRA